MCSEVEMSGILSAIIRIVLTVKAATKLPIALIRSCACLQRTLTNLV
jgi:hypothetical protein